MALFVFTCFLALVTITTADVKSISCGQELRGTFYYFADAIEFQFNNSARRDVLFTNCDSDFDSTMYLYDDSGSEIQSQSTNGCSGDNCYTDSVYPCSNSNKETFLMQNLNAGTYRLILDQIDLDSGYEPWSVEIICYNATTPTVATDATDDSSSDDVYRGSYCDQHSECEGYWYDMYCTDSYSCDGCSTCYYCSDGVDNSCGSSCGTPTYEYSCSSSSSTSSSSSSFTDNYSSFWWIIFLGLTGFWFLRYMLRKCRQSQHNEQMNQSNSNGVIVATNNSTTTMNATPGTSTYDPVKASNTNTVNGSAIPMTTVQYVVQPVGQVPSGMPVVNNYNSGEGTGGGLANAGPVIQANAQPQVLTTPGVVPLWSTNNQSVTSGDAPPPAYEQVDAPPAYNTVDAPPAYDQVVYQ